MLTEEMVVNYLVNVRTLSEINNHDVKDPEGNKVGQTPLTIQVGKKWIEELLDYDNNREDDNFTEQEKALISLQSALDGLPVSMSYQALVSVVVGLDSLQKNLFDAVNAYLTSITQVEQHQLILKALVLVLKIIEYDLGKKNEPITIGVSYFKFTVLTAEQRSANHVQVQALLTRIIDQFDKHYEQSPERREYINSLVI